MKLKTVRPHKELRTVLNIDGNQAFFGLNYVTFGRLSDVDPSFTSVLRVIRTNTDMSAHIYHEIPVYPQLNIQGSTIIIDVES